ncbi:MAG: GYF domain-containing protein [Myxococcales bacterium]|jgi:predicted Zn finger-like uncharacterized protein
MKVVCEGCQAKYQIPDERVAGRKLKIRCRKCNGAIIIRGDLLGAQAPRAHPEEPVTVAAAVDEWHVSLDGEQHGPYDTPQMVEMLAAGQLGWDAFVWREGMADWEMASDCQPLREVYGADTDADVHEQPTVAQDAPTVARPAPGGEDVPTRMYQSDSFAPGDGLQPTARESFARSHQHPAATPPVGPNPSSAFAPDAAFDTPRVSAGQTLTGERHEDSVLFSTNNLALAQPTPSQPARGGYASGEGSGLIDIRALASLASSSQSSPPASTGIVPPPGNGASNEDQLLRLANQTGAFGAVDSLAPVTSRGRSSSNAVPVAILAGAAMIAAAAFLAVYITRDTPAGSPTAAVDPATAQAAAAQPVAPEPAPEQTALPAAEEPEDEGEPAEAPDDEQAEAQDEAQDGQETDDTAEEESQAREQASAKVARSAPRKARKARKQQRAKATPPKPAPKAPEANEASGGASLDDVLLSDSKKSEPEPEKAEEPAPDPLLAGPSEPKDAPKEPPKERSLDDLLAGAVAKPEKLPDSPTRDQVLKAIAGVKKAVMACGQGQDVGGTARAQITVSGSSGRVSHVNVTGIQGTVGSCVAREVRKARFPKFAKPTFSVAYPFKF